MIIIASKRKKSESILEKYPDAIIADVTSQAKDGLVKLSPFYPHHDILYLLAKVGQPLVWKPFGKV